MKQTICPNCSGSLESVAIGWRCKKCKGFISLQDGKFYEYVEKPFMPPPTNADRIRAMSDEELLHWLLRLQDDAIKRFANFELPNYQSLADWLKLPADGGAE